MNFLFENFLAMLALTLMMISIVLQINHIRFKRGSKKLFGKITELVPKKFGRMALIEFEYEGKNFKSKALSFNRLLHMGSDIEVLIHPLEMLKFENPSFINRFLIKKGWYKKEFPKIYLCDPNFMLYHFGIIIFCLLLMVLN